MQNLVPIGRFAKLTQLTVKALRLYDKSGLLRPAAVGFQSGFRYYSLDQVPMAAQIRLLRSLEMPLEEIGILLRAANPGTAHACLARHRRRLEERITTCHNSSPVLTMSTSVANV